MSTVTAKVLINTKFAAATASAEYTAPTSTRVIIDKFTATNTDSVVRTVTVNIVPSGSGVATGNTITSAFSLAAGVTASLTEMQNQILAAGDLVYVSASLVSKVVIRMSGREIV